MADGRPLYCTLDDQSATAMAKSSVGHKRAKYIDIKYHFIRETVQICKITVS